jgi:prepilin-type N-terminal cleavage/methylation domain-containing protein
MKNRNRGFTLIELIIFIIVGAIILPTSFVAFTAAIKYFSTPDYYVKARFYAEQRIEMITSNAYNVNYFGISVPTGDRTESLTGFSRTWSVCYVLPNDINTCSGGSTDTNYQKIDVRVTPPSGPDYTVATLVTRRPKP